MFFRAIRALVATAFINHLLIGLVYAELGMLDVMAVTLGGESGHFFVSPDQR
jgi:hypothetical protein